MSENISGIPAGRSVSHLTSPYIGLLARNNFRLPVIRGQSVLASQHADSALCSREDP